MLFLNTITKQKETFKQKGQVKIYTCGPTVYNYVHLGNLRAYIFADTLVRYLKYRGYETRWVMNITDIDDKTINGAKNAKLSLAQFTKKYEKAFFEDLKALNIQKADVYPRATEHIREIQDLIIKLYNKGCAYEKDGSVYFNIAKFKNYGKLSKIDLSAMLHGARVDQDLYQKEKSGDFVLWKKAKPNEPKWDLKIGDKKLSGRPGWHIECSAMSMKYLGETIDFHLGGIDLIFPHHENEIAQSEAATEKQFVKIWLHNEHLMVDGKKMAKSDNNFYTLRDLIKKGFDPITFRYLCLQSEYHSKMNFTWQSLKAAENALNEIRKLGQRENIKSVTPSLLHSITSSLDNDLDTPEVLAVLHKENNYNLWQEFESVLGLKLKTQMLKLKTNIKELITKREELRKQGKFNEADKIRQELKKKGYEIEDTEKGPEVIDI